MRLVDELNVIQTNPYEPLLRSGVYAYFSKYIERLFQDMFTSRM